VRDLSGAAEVEEIAAERDGLEQPGGLFFIDEQNLVATDRKGKVTIINLGSYERKELDCFCRPELVQPMSFRSVFRLTDIHSGALWILQNTEDPKLFFIPVDSGDEGVAQ
jgi:hypothetical protein